MSRAVVISVVLHLLFTIWGLSRWMDSRPQLPGRFTVVLTTALATSPQRAVPRTAPTPPSPRPPAPAPRRKPVPVPPAPPVAKAAQTAVKPRPQPAPQPVAETGDEAEREVVETEPAATVAEAAPEPAYVPPRRLAQVHNPKPFYPRVARRRGMEGRVLLKVVVAADGTVAAVSILASSGYRILDQAAVETVRTWRFAPAHRAGQAVQGSLTIPVRFRLRDAQAAG